MKGYEIGAMLSDGDLPGLHVGLAMGALAPLAPAEGKVPDAARAKWLEKLTRITVSGDYEPWFVNRWKKSIGRCLQGIVEANTRLFAGAGDPSGVDVGLRVHHTWGVPCIPGSSLKGLLSHWLDTVYGPSSEHDGTHPWDPRHPEPDRAKFRRAVRGGQRTQGAGEAQRVLFGSPEIDGDVDRLREWGGLPLQSGTSACRGRIVIHDALFVPGSARGKPFLADVLTVHHKDYYQGKSAPNDYDSPNPVGFLSVRPGTQLLLAVGLAPGEKPDYEPWVDFAFTHLVDALADWGIGSKTAAGYGRMAMPDGQKPRIPEKRADEASEVISAWLTEHVDELRKVLESPDAPTRFAHTVAEQHGDAIRSASGGARKERLQIIYSFLAKVLKPSKNKSAAIRDALTTLFPDD